MARLRTILPALLLLLAFGGGGLRHAHFCSHAWEHRAGDAAQGSIDAGRGAVGASEGITRLQGHCCAKHHPCGVGSSGEGGLATHGSPPRSPAPLSEEQPPEVPGDATPDHHHPCGHCDMLAGVASSLPCPALGLWRLMLAPIDLRGTPERLLLDSLGTGTLGARGPPAASGIGRA